MEKIEEVDTVQILLNSLIKLSRKHKVYVTFIDYDGNHQKFMIDSKTVSIIHDIRHNEYAIDIK